MKNSLKLSFLFAFAFTSISFAQTNTFEKNGWELSGGFGYDQAIKKLESGGELPKNNGNYANFSAAKFWKVIGINASTRYTFNSTNSYFKTNESQSLSSSILTNFSENRVPLQRIDLAVGPMLNLPLIKNKLIFQIGAEGGMSLTNGSELVAKNNAGTLWGDMAYSKDLIPFARPKANLNFQMSDKWALGFTGHYARYFNDKDLSYLKNGLNQATHSYSLDSWGFGINITYMMGKSRSTIPKTTKEQVSKNIKIKVLDKETELPLKNSKVYLTNENGAAIRGVTDENGEFVYEKLLADNYKVYSELNGIKTPLNEIFPADFETNNETVEISLLHFDPRFTLNGLTVNKVSNMPEGLVYVILKNKETGKEDLVVSKKADGTFSFQLEPKTDYSIFGRKDNFISEIEKVSTKGLERSKTLYTQLAIGLEETEIGKIINLENIYYDLDRANIREDASDDLLKLVQFMSDNPKVKIEIDSHTDSRGKEEYNYALSQARAQSAVDFVIRRGISANRLIAKGFGESRLVNYCADGVECTEAEHQKNRRTEFKVIE